MKVEIPDELFNEEEKQNTPGRILGFYKELERKRNYSKWTCFPNVPKVKEMIVMKNIKYSSLCSHHLLPFEGTAHVAYIPDKTICGASKIPRAVEKFASRPQLQEKMTSEIADFLVELMNPLGVMVITIGKHKCMGCRGVKNSTAEMMVSAIRGVFKKPPEGKDPRGEFLQLIKLRGIKE